MKDVLKRKSGENPNASGAPLLGAFVNRRKEPRLPFSQKIICSTQEETKVTYSLNISRGGVFLLSLDPFPVATTIHVAMWLPGHDRAFTCQGWVTHIVFDRLRCEVECGMGVQFQNLNETQSDMLDMFCRQEQDVYARLLELFENKSANRKLILEQAALIPNLRGRELLEIQYRVHRVCTLFEPEHLDSALPRLKTV